VVVTKRRWLAAFENLDPDDIPLGPIETALRGELQRLGWAPDMDPGVLRTSAERALALAETMDHCQNVAYLPPLDRQLSAILIEARAASGVVEEDEDREEEISDFEAERARRRPPPRAVQ
jgi:hypothetical protein